MKNRLFVVLALIIVFASFTACGKEVQLNDNNVRTAKSIIKSVDAYLDGEIGAEEACEKVENEYSNIDEDDDENNAALLFSSKTLIIKTELSHMSYDGKGDVSKIKENRNDIAELIGEKKY